MTRRPYTPQPGTIPHKAIEHLKTLPAGTELATPALAEALGFADANFGAYLHNALKGGALKNRKRSGERWVLWSLGDGKPVAAQVDGEDDEDKPQKHVNRPLAQAPVSSVFEMGRGVVNGVSGTDGLDMDAIHRRHDNVIEMDARATVSGCPTAGLDWTPGPCTACAAEPDAHEHFARATIDAPLLPTSAVPEINITPTPLPRIRAGTTPYRFGIFEDGEFVQEKGGQRIAIGRDELERLVKFIRRMCGEGAA